MAPSTNVKVSAQFVHQTADALRHYYDSASLAVHPILTQLEEPLSGDRSVAAQKLRRLLLDAVEDLRPQAGTPPDSPAWRPFRVLHGRYILAKGLETLETELGLSRRQIQREQRVAFVAVAMSLWARRATAQGEQSPEVRDSMSQEISRVASQVQAFDALVELAGALEPIKAFAQHQRTELIAQHTVTTMRVLGNPDLLRQFLVSALSLVVRVASAGGSSVRVESRAASIACTVFAPDGRNGAGTPQHVELPEPLRELARANGATLSQEQAGGAWRLLIELRAAPQSRTVAIIEDNRDLVQLYSRYVASHGYRLVEVSDSVAAVERIAEMRPDAVVLDLMMSKVDGWQILQRLQSDRSLRQIPVAVCSVLNEPELAKSLGAKAYLRKPVRPAELLECLTQLLAQSYSAEASSSPATR